MRVFVFILGLAAVLLQYRVWMSEHGVREVSRLTAQVEAQAAANVEQRARNRQLAAEVTDLKVGLTALEERARSELGMVGSNETFYQVVTSGPAQSAEPAGEGAPGSGAPGLRAPGSGAPGLRAPGSGAPGLRAPGSGAPGLRAPGRTGVPAAPAAITARAQ